MIFSLIQIYVKSFKSQRNAFLVSPLVGLGMDVEEVEDRGGTGKERKRGNGSKGGFGGWFQIHPWSLHWDPKPKGPVVLYCNG